MKEQRRRRGLSGAVLIMILTIMAVLIVILMTTLTVVTAANQRIYTKFEENQAYYSARSALDVFMDNMLSDNGYYAQSASGGDVAYIHGNNVLTDKMKQGLGLQIDIYSIVAYDPDAIDPVTGARGVYGENVRQYDLDIHATTISGTADAKDEYHHYFGTTGTTATNGPTELVYKVTMPVVSDGSDSYGKLSDNLEATIKVQVLDRVYNLGTYKDASGADQIVPEADQKEFLAHGDPNYPGNPYNYVTPKMAGEAFANGDRTKDKVRIKITATTVFNGVEGTAVLICNNEEGYNPPNPGSKAITTFAGSGSDNLYIYGGASMADNVNWNNDGKIYGGVYAEKNVDINSNGPYVYLEEGESFYIGGDFTTSNTNFAVRGFNVGTDKDKRPFVYVEGTYYSGNTTPTTYQDVDLIVKSGFKTTQNDFYWNGDMYCKGNFDFSAGADGDHVTINGDVFIQGNAIGRANSKFRGYIDGAGNKVIDVSGVSGTVHISGKFYDAAGTEYDPNDPSVTIIGNIDPTLAVDALDTALPTPAEVQDPTSGVDKITIPLPGGVTKTLPTHVENFDLYYQKDASGNVILDGSGKPIPIDAVTYSGVDFDNPTFMNGAASLPSNTTIDTSTGNAQYVYNGGHAENLTITGGGLVEILVTGHSGGSSRVNILVDDDPGNTGVSDGTAVIFYMPDNTYKFEKFQVYTSATKRATTVGGSPLNVGSAGGPGVMIPNINYFCKGTLFYTQNDYFMTGYFYGPDTVIDSSVGNGKVVNMNYNASPTVSDSRQDKVTIVGSVLCHMLKLPNQHGIAYINPNTPNNNSVPAGDSLYNWTAYRYARN